MNNYSYGLIGYPLGHSFSDKYFSEKFMKENIPSTYTLFPIPSIGDFPDLIRNNPSLLGINVTIPYKEQVMDYLDELSEASERIGAVNVIKINRTLSGSFILKGYNSDYIGFRDSIAPLLTPKIKKALILGTGGASKAVEFALEKLGIECKKVSRNPSETELGYSDLSKEIMHANRLIVNTTPLGMSPNENTCPPIPYSLITPCHICYDLVYNPSVTEFMRRCAVRGATIKNGLEMLFRQADAAWDIWQK